MKLSHFSSSLRRGRLAFASAALLSGLAAVGFAARDDAKPPVEFKVDPAPIQVGAMEPNTFREIAKKVSPSVVKITTETRARSTRGEASDLGQMDPFFRQFFGDRLPELRQPPQAGLGSGVIISPDGYIATNNHVIENADVLTITLADGNEYRAEVVGRDPQTDVALVKVEAKNLPALTFADSSQVAVGDRVLAVGTPFGLGGTVTTGIVSATSRRAGLGLDYEDFIQTDAAINPGNSGGALVDLQGRLIGLNTAILSRSGGFQGIGLAVPADLVRHVVGSLAKNGEVVRGHLGVGVQNLTPALATQFELKSRDGALITDVRPDSAAEEAGLKGGDVITKFNGKPVTDAGRLSLEVAQTAPGTKVELEVLRDGERQTLNATVGEQPNDGKRNRTGGLSKDDSDEGVLNGVAVTDLTPQARRRFEIPPRVEGALITNVDPSSASARAGLKPGDVILEINRQPVTNADEAVQLSADAPEKQALVKLWSRGGTIYTVVDETEATPRQ